MKKKREKKEREHLHSIRFPIQLKSSEMSWATVSHTHLEINWEAHYTSGKSEMREWGNEPVEGITPCAITGPATQSEISSRKMMDFCHGLPIFFI